MPAVPILLSSSLAATNRSTFSLKENCVLAYTVFYVQLVLRSSEHAVQPKPDVRKECVQSIGDVLA